MIKRSIKEEPHIHILGRSYADDSAVTLFWTASGIEFDIEASELWVELRCDYGETEPWISIEINGYLMSRLMLTQGTHKLCVFRNMNGDTKKHVRIMRETPAMVRDEKCLLQILSVSHDGRIVDMEKRKLFIEFVGDSITSGEGSYGSRTEGDWLPMFFSATHNYAVMTADRLDADFSIISQSGWGVYLSWDKNPEHILPPYYEQLCGVLKGERNLSLHANDVYDFSQKQPDAVVVNLGTNDTYALALEGGGYDEEGVKGFKRAVADFLKTIRKNNKTAEIVWAYGMLGRDFYDCINEAIEEYRAVSSDSRVSFLLLPETTPETVGALGHPGVQSHIKAADTLVKYLEEKLRLNK